jgi:polyphenol oxidase
MSVKNPDCWLTAHWPAAAQVHAGVTTRLGGVSVGPYASFNLAAHVQDDPHAVQRNRAMLRERLALPVEPCWLTQVHGNNVIAAAQAFELPPSADASVTDQPNVVCTVMTADCLPVLLCDRAGHHVAAVHAGWRGLHNRIISATVKHLPVAPTNLLAWLGPAIGPAAFEVGADVHAAFVDLDPAYAAVFTVKDAQHWWMDVYAAARLELSQLGVTAVYGGDLCTFQDAARFYSYRRDGVTGRMASLIWFTP